MRPPVRRAEIPPRNRDNNKRRLSLAVSPEQIQELVATVQYEGSPKHKRNPHLYGLEPYKGVRGDATLCDEHAGFQPQDVERIGVLIARGLKAGLFGTNIWTVDDGGWIYEGRLTNQVQSQYHAYPVRPGEAIAEAVYERFKRWVETEGDERDKQAAQNCAVLYGF